jgi:hypothetical protein
MGYGNWNGGSAKGFGGQKVYYYDPKTGKSGVVRKEGKGATEYQAMQKFGSRLTTKTVTVATLLKYGVAVLAVGVVAWLISK